MFSSNDKYSALWANASRLLRSSGSASITVRLALLYSLAAFTTLLLVAAVLYWAVINGIQRDDQRFLAEKFEVLRAMLRERPHDRALLDEEVRWETGVFANARYFVQITDLAGHPLVETPGLQQAGIDTEQFPAAIPVSLSEPDMTRVATTSRRIYLLSAAEAQLGSEPQARRIVRIALDVSHEKRLLTELLHVVYTVLLVGVLLSGAIGALVARRGLRRLTDMTRAVQATSAAQLHARIESSDWPRELQALVTAFNGMLERLELAFSRISGFAADLAHELRTPLNNLRGATEVALARPRTQAQYRQVLESNLEECERLSRMADSLLFLARAENPEFHLQYSTFEARTEIDAVANFYDPAAREREIQITCEGAGCLLADRELFRRAVGNLLSNAIRHTLPGGQVVARAECLVDGAIEVAVADTGVGIPSHEQTKVFQRFYRGDGEKQRDAGAGLGLAIAKSIMALHHGSIRLTSGVGQGTTVTLHFPPPQASEH